jgi:hypothetical protein
MNLSLGIAVGSGLQIAMFAIPLSVLVGWAIGQPFSLEVDLFALLALVFRWEGKGFGWVGACVCVRERERRRRRRDGEGTAFLSPMTHPPCS